MHVYVWWVFCLCSMGMVILPLVGLPYPLCLIVRNPQKSHTMMGWPYPKYHVLNMSCLVRRFWRLFLDQRHWGPPLNTPGPSYQSRRPGDGEDADAGPSVIIVCQWCYGVVDLWHTMATVSRRERETETEKERDVNRWPRMKTNTLRERDWDKETKKDENNHSAMGDTQDTKP